MSQNVNLNIAQREKYDEFYTMMDDIENELRYYTVDIPEEQRINHFKNKIVYCNCDNPAISNFWKYFVAYFSKLKLQEVICTHYNADDQPSYMLSYRGMANKEGAPSFLRKQLSGNGDCFSPECIEILKYADIICTNPPFSKIKSYIPLLIKYRKKFLIIGPINALKYKDIFPYIKKQKIWLGVNSGSMKFCTPSVFNKSNVAINSDTKMAKFGNICWYTNLKHNQYPVDIPLEMSYYRNRELYPMYDTIEAINIDRIKNISYDYDGLMGVPITIMQHFKPNQFEIIGQLNNGTNANYDFAKAVIGGNEKYPRILIRNRYPQQTK